MRKPLLVLTFLAWAPATLAAVERSVSYSRVIDLELGSDTRHVHWGPRLARPRDRSDEVGDPAKTGNTRLDLFVHGGNRVRIWWQTSRGFAPHPDEVLRLPSEPGLVDFGDVEGDAGEEVVILTARGVFADRARQLRAERRSGPGGLVGEQARESDPGGVFHRLTLSRGGVQAAARSTAPGGPIPVPFFHVASRLLEDIDGDGRDDLVVPRQRRYEVYFRRAEKFVAVAFLEAEHGVSIDPGGPRLVDPLEIEVEVSGLDFKDLNGDRLTDIAVSKGRTRRFYLQGKEGFPPQPSYELDLALFKSAGSSSARNTALSGRDPGVFGRDRARMHEVDIDGDGLLDYVVAAGQVIRVYFGGKDGVDFTRPHLARRLSSELQGVGSFDIDGDGRLDLVALKFEMPGIPRLIAAYFVPMSLELEILGYLNRGGRNLSRRPDRRRLLTIHLPAIRSMIEEFDSVSERFLAAVARQDRFQAADIDGDGLRDAAFVDDDNRLRVYFGRPDEAEIPTAVEVGDLLFHPDKTEWNIEELLDFIGGAAYAAARERVADRPADLEIPLGQGYAARLHESMELRDIDGDGTLDFVLRMKGARLKLLLSRQG